LADLEHGKRRFLADLKQGSGAHLVRLYRPPGGAGSGGFLTVTG
jgi:hypothetical protein